MFMLGMNWFWMIIGLLKFGLEIFFLFIIFIGMYVYFEILVILFNENKFCWFFFSIGVVLWIIVVLDVYFGLCGMVVLWLLKLYIVNGLVSEVGLWERFDVYFGSRVWM